MPLNRRRFLQRSALGVGSLVFGSQAGLGEEPQFRGFDPAEQVRLGSSSVSLSRLCLGTGVHGFQRESDATRLGREKFEALLRGAYERGVRSFDLADLYGTHSYVLPALKGLPRESFQIITKIWFHKNGLPETERPDANVVVERFLKELGTQCIDLLLLHCMTSPDWPKEMRRQMDMLAELKAKGVIRAHGVSCHSLAALKAAALEPWVDSVHARVNPFGMMTDGSVEELLPVFRELQGAGKGIVGMKIIGEGRLAKSPEKIDQSLRFALNEARVDVLNIGCDSLAQIDDLTARIRRIPRATA